MTTLVIPPRDGMEMLSSTGRVTENALGLVVMGSVFTAMGSNLRTITVSVAGQAGADVANIRSALSQAGYQVSQPSGSNLVVSW